MDVEQEDELRSIHCLYRMRIWQIVFRIP